MSLIRAHRERGDSGAVAVIVAICAIVLFGTAAMAVDLGNAWSRKRSAQTDADFAALAGAAKLPASTPAQMTAARQAAWTYLNDNLPRDDDGATINPLPDYSDGNYDNGEITFPDSATIKVVTQRVHVSFGLAGAIGFQGNNPQAQAIAAVRSPKRLLPFFLPVNCATGQQIIKKGGGGSGYNFQPVATGSNPPIADTFTPASITQYVAGTVADVTGQNLAGDATQVALIAPDGSQVLPPVISQPDPLDPDHIRFTVPALGVTGTWYVQVRTPLKLWSSDNTTGGQAAPSFNVPAGTPTACGQSDTGDFGLMDSPRAGETGDTFDLNLSLGLDHGLACFPGTTMPVGSSCVSTGGTTYALPDPTVSDNCRMHPANTPIPGGVLDNDPSIDTANCADVRTGNNVGDSTQGLITGGSANSKTFTGRLTQNLNTGCPPPIGGSNPRTVTIGSTNYDINNDTPDCYFLPTVTGLDQVRTATAPVFSSDIYNSPRFFFVPVFQHNFAPQNGYYPIVDFKGVFITDEDVATPATPANGIIVNGGQGITSLKVFVIPLAGLPDLANVSGGTIPYLGAGPKVPVLID